MFCLRYLKNIHGGLFLKYEKTEVTKTLTKKRAMLRLGDQKWDRKRQRFEKPLFYLLYYNINNTRSPRIHC